MDTTLDPYKPYLEERLGAGVWNAQVLLRELRQRGYAGGYTILTDWLRPQREAARVAAVRRFETVPGEQAQVDWGHLGDLEMSGQARKLWGFAFTLGYSRMLMAEAALDQKLGTLLRMHEEAFHQLGGVPREILYDRMRTVWQETDERGEILWNAVILDFARYWGFQPRLCRPYRAQTKAKAEAGVLLVERWILAALRQRTFFSLGEVNEAIAELLVRLNERSFRKREGSRRTLFETPDRPALKPLPRERYQYGEWKTVRVNIDYHVGFDHHWYSVPYQLTQRQVEIRATASTVEIFHQGRRIASPVRSYAAHRHSTIHDHRPKAHQRHLEWTPSRIIEWCGQIGPATAQVVEQILASNRHPEQGYRSCLGVVRLGEKYPHPAWKPPRAAPWISTSVPTRA